MAFFFFQAEDGIRDVAVTGVQTCALPISLTCSAPTARSRTRSTTPRVTSKLTSASSRWRRISRSASVTSLSESTPRPRSRCNTPVICSARAVNISQAKYLASCRNPSGGLNASWRYPNRGNRPPAGPSRRRVHQPHPGAAIDGESVDPRPATPRRPSAPPTRPGPLKPPRETGGGGRVGPHRVPDQRVRPLFRREHAVAVAVPTTGELGRLCLGRITKELLEEQSDLELAQIVLVTHGTVAPGELEDRRVVVAVVAIGMEDLLGGNRHRGAERLVARMSPVEPADEVRAREIGEDQGFPQPQGGVGILPHLSHLRTEYLARLPEAGQALGLLLGHHDEDLGERGLSFEDRLGRRAAVVVTLLLQYRIEVQVLGLQRVDQLVGGGHSEEPRG